MQSSKNPNPNANEINFFKLQNSKLFQKFLKEESQPQKPSNNVSKRKEKEEERNSSQGNNMINNDEYSMNYDSQKNFKSNNSQSHTRFSQKFTPLKPKEDNFISRKSNNDEERELAGYSQIVPGFII